MDAQSDINNAQAPATAKPGCPIPPRQQPYERAFEMGFDALLSGGVSAFECRNAKLEALGATARSGIIRLPVLNQALLIDPGRREVLVENGDRARRAWSLLALHYLCADDVSLDTREVSFGHLADSRSYVGVFARRIIGRFMATVGKTSELFEQLSEQLGATRLPPPGVGYRFDVLPRVPVAIIRHEGDNEIEPDANVIYRADAEHLLPTEDCVVAVELLLDTLSGKPIAEAPGGGDEKRR